MGNVSTILQFRRFPQVGLEILGVGYKNTKKTQAREIVSGVLLELQKPAKRGARITITYPQ